MPSPDTPTALPAKEEPINGDILVALNPSPLDHENAKYLLRVAAQNAKRLRILVVEDERLHRLATLPFTKEVDWTGASQKRLNATDVGRMLRAQAERIRVIVGKLAGEFELSYSVDVVRGDFHEKALAERRERIVVLGAGHQWHRVTRASYSPSLARAVSVFDGSEATLRACRVAKRLASSASRLTVLLPSENEANCEMLRDQLTGAVPSIEDAGCEVICLPRDELLTKLQEFGREPESFLILPRAGILGSETTAQEFVRNMRGNLALVA